MSDSKFYKSRVTMTVLSDRPVEDMDVKDIIYQCDDGDMVLHSIVVAAETLSRAQLDAALIEAGSDPEFFPSDED